uniref:RING-type domain-containing protein n=1 Tax=Panagrellus redivivus TaxID=6233 RepID=A0A7E4URQ4_PANRE
MPPKTNFLFGSSPDFEMSRCRICYNTYNRTHRAPTSMPCGHTFCHGCIRQMTTEILFSCGVCRTVSLVGWSGTKKNVALIQTLDKLNLLASDDTDVSDSSPLGSNAFLQDEINNVDPNEMLYHSERSLKILSGYLKSHYGTSNSAVQTIDKAVGELEMLKPKSPEVAAQGTHNFELDMLINEFNEADFNVDLYDEMRWENLDRFLAELGRLRQEIESNSYGVNSNGST